MDRLSVLRRLSASRIPMTEDLDVPSLKATLKFPNTSTLRNGELLDHQTEHVDKLLHVLSRQNSAADTSPAGTGKTHTTACIASKLGLPVMVFCPKSVIVEWYRTLRTWGCSIVAITNYDMARSSHSDTDVKWYDMREGFTENATICPWVTKEKKMVRRAGVMDSTIKFTWHLPYKCMIVFDEEHVGKNINTQTFSLIKGAILASKRQGHKIMLLSATPIEKKSNLKSIMYFLGLIATPDMDNVNKYFRQHIGSVEMSDIHNYLYAINCGDTTKDSGCIASMPNIKPEEGIINDVRPITVEMEEDIVRKIAERNREILLLKERLRERSYEGGTLGSINTNRRIIENYKIDKAVELAVNGLTQPRDSCGPYRRVCIFVNYKDVLHELSARISKVLSPNDVAVYHGDQTPDKATEACNNYRSGKAKVMIATIDKGGTALSLHDTDGDKETLVIILPPTSATKFLQCLGRHFRARVKSSVTQLIIFAKGDVIEESIRDNLAIKMNDICNFTLGTKGDIDLYEFVSSELRERILSEMGYKRPPSRD